MRIGIPNRLGKGSKIFIPLILCFFDSLYTVLFHPTPDGTFRRLKVKLQKQRYVVSEPRSVVKSTDQIQKTTKGYSRT